MGWYGVLPAFWSLLADLITEVEISSMCWETVCHSMISIPGEKKITKDKQQQQTPLLKATRGAEDVLGLYLLITAKH